MFDKAINDVIACLDDKSPYVVKTAIQVAIKHRIKNAHKKIIHLLKSKDESIRETATVALEFINGENNFNVALTLYNDKNEKIKKLIPHIFFIIANNTNWEKAYDVMKHDNNDKARLTACKLLLKFGTETEKKDINSFLHDKNGHIRNLVKATNTGFISPHSTHETFPT
jgi:HEAT repeat protein